KTDNQNFTPDMELMGLLGVRFVVSEFDIPLLQSNEVARFSNTRVYENSYFYGLAWIERGGEKLPILNLQIQPNRLELTAKGPGKLLVSHIYYPGWIASMDGQAVKFTTSNGLFPVFELPDGEHTIELEFQPVLVYIGLSISIISWVTVILLLLYTNKTRFEVNAHRLT
ncbi:MAG: YfhO family protein, partial [Bellilinea sp.]